MSPWRARFDVKVAIQESGCWLWTAAKDADGYGIFGVNRRSVLAHRFLYESERGAVPSGLELDHLCRNRACVNPDHLEAVSHRENMLRSRTPNNIERITREQTGACSKGHPVERLRGRVCRDCDNERKRALYANNPRRREYFKTYTARRRFSTRKAE